MKQIKGVRERGISLACTREQVEKVINKFRMDCLQVANRELSVKREGGETGGDYMQNKNVSLHGK
jgi:hypothetical protein